MYSRKLGMGLLLVAILAGAPFAAALADPPPWAPAHGYRAKHHYTYYPSHEIYYEPANSLWFWFADGDWHFGANLPLAYRAHVHDGVSVELDSDRPYHHHSHVVETYGGKKGKGRK